MYIYILIFQGIGCYMFRIDDTDVVDATMKGSAARFINHSCEVNYYMSQCMRYPTMWYVRPANPQISLRICAV